MRGDPELRIDLGRHVAATARGEIALTLTGPAGCRATVTLKSERKIPSRWLERGRPRVVTLATRRFTFPVGGRVKVTLRLSPQHLALLRRMGAMHAVARAATSESRTAKSLIVHAPARRGPGRRRVQTGGARRSSAAAERRPSCFADCRPPGA